MMAAGRIDDDQDEGLEAEVANLWADGFDSVDITESLKTQGHKTTEAKVCRILRDQQDRRWVAKTGRARGDA